MFKCVKLKPNFQQEKKRFKQNKMNRTHFRYIKANQPITQQQEKINKTK